MLGITRTCRHQWAFLIGCIFICFAFAGGVDFFEIPCTDNANCTVNPGSKCDYDPGTSANKCGCDTKAGFNKTGNICRVEVEFGKKCNNIYAFCKQEKSTCAHAGDLSSDKRCACIQDYVAVNDNGTIKCAKVLTKQDNSDCTTCINNDGICYEFFDKSRKCRCPVSRIGDECETILVHVQCQRFQLDVCYQPHPGVNITKAEMYTHGYGTKPACRARVTTGLANSTFCPANRMRLTLNLSPTELEICGIQRMTFDSNYIRYVAMIEVMRTATDIEPILFKTYCEFEDSKQIQVETAVKGVNLNDRGERKTATLKFIARDALGNDIKTGDTVRIGDKISLLAMVAIDGVYTGVNVRRCVASSSPQIPDPKAMTKLIYENGCPAEDQPYIPKDGRWRRVMGRLNEWTTGEFAMFKLPQGTSIYIHCTVGFCMGNDTNACEPSKCGDTTPAPPVTVAQNPAVTNAAGSNATAAQAAPAAATTQSPAAANATAALPAAVTTAASAAVTTASGNISGRRKKRDLAQEVNTGPESEAAITFALKTEEPENYGNSPSTGVAARLNMSNSTFAGFLAGVILILLLLMIISAVLLVRMKKGGADSSDKVAMTDRPQRFALPRNNHLRL